MTLHHIYDRIHNEGDPPPRQTAAAAELTLSDIEKAIVRRLSQGNS